ncbi:MAG: OmcA/MtrC family decaheme c-type cytochrome [Burkholderiales bacterium]|nr:OmcA/MtrC family decaheme c-type cytochrome [Burkholderiales bacterium]
MIKLKRYGLAATAALGLLLAGCGGGGGASLPATTVNPPSTSGIATGTAGLTAAKSLTVTITSVTVSGPPVVDFVVTNEQSQGMTGLAASDLRFNIAKLVPSAGGGPANWQNYINRASGGAVQGTQERVATGYAHGTLVGHGGGAYTYTFATDITSATANPCPSPCTDAAGKALDLSYAPALTHRVTIQQANGAYPTASGIFDWVPNGGPVVIDRDVVATDNCNSCHAQLTVHGTRVDTRLCVTCHNPGSWVAGTPNVTVDFKALVHRIHYNDAGAALPSVQAGVKNLVNGTDFSAVTFPQDVRNCTRCHNASGAQTQTLTGAKTLSVATPQGNNWQQVPSIAACGSCHDNVYFGVAPDPAKPYQTKAHDGGVQADDSTCAGCHAAGKFTGAQDIVVAHSLPAQLKSAAAKFSFNILGVSPTTPGANPVITFSVTDPTNGNAPYDIKTAAAFTAGGASTLSLQLAWSTSEFNNAASGQAWGQPISINALTAATPGGTAGTYQVTSPVALPVGLTGSLRVVMQGHPAGAVTTPGSYADRLAVKSVFRDVAVSGSVTPRRAVVDIAKCDVCHDVLSLHGNNRTDEIGVCVTCHNPNATDAARRPASGAVDGLAEQAIDFKTMVHGIHAGQASKGGFRNQGLVVYGFGGSVNDFSSVVFPGRLNDCSTCHIGASYQLGGVWAAPVAGGILGTTVSSAAGGKTPTANLRNSPTAAVCSSCHDGAQDRAHMQNPGNGGQFGVTQATLAAGAGEGCVICHGPGTLYDVQTVHAVP